MLSLKFKDILDELKIALDEDNNILYMNNKEYKFSSKQQLCSCLKLFQMIYINTYKKCI